MVFGRMPVKGTEPKLNGSLVSASLGSNLTIENSKVKRELALPMVLACCPCAKESDYRHSIKRNI